MIAEFVSSGAPGCLSFAAVDEDHRSTQVALRGGRAGLQGYLQGKVTAVIRG